LEELEKGNGRKLAREEAPETQGRGNDTLKKEILGKEKIKIF